MTDNFAKIFAAIVALAVLQVAWRPLALSRHFGDVTAVGIQLRPLVLTLVVFIVASIVLPFDQPFRRYGFIGAIGAAQLVWIAFRSNPASRPLVGDRDRTHRIATLSSDALLGAVAGAGVAILVWTARQRERLHDVAWIGAIFGIGAGLAIWERRGGRHERPGFF